MLRFRHLIGSLSVLLGAAPCTRAQIPTAPPSLRHEIIRGVVTAAGKPVDSADVIITRAPDRAFKSTKTDRTGSYHMDWPDGTGDYLVHVSAPGYQAARKRITRTGADTVLVADIALNPVVQAQQLGPVVSTARKPKPDRNPPFGPDVGASEQTTGGLVGKLPPDLAGDLAALASTLPGVTPVAGGISVLGLSPDQNSTTLNGMSFAGSDTPRDANTRVRVSASAYDPSRGWFSGANTNVELAPGSLFGSRRSHVTLDAPTLQYTDPVSAKLGQRFTSGQFSLGADGELIENKWYYNMGLQGGRKSAPVTSLATATPDLLRAAGIAKDSADRLLSLLGASGVPVSGSAFPTAAVTDNISFIGRFDHKPFDPETLGPAVSTWGITTYAKYARSGALSESPMATAAHAGESSQAIASAQASYSTYFGDDYLADLRSGLSFARTQVTPYTLLPDARVFVRSDFSDLTGGASSLLFGGNGTLASDARQWTWENSADVQLYASGTPAHKLKFSGDVRLDGFSQDATPNTLGAFAYNSLTDVAANQPASFTRTLSNPGRQDAEWNAFLAAGDLWRINPSWQLLYGARLEGNAFTAALAENPDVERVFGLRTDHAPSALEVSPRFGFNYNRTGQIRNTNIGNNLGRFTGTTPGVLRGGFGEFRGFTPANLLSNALVSTALPGSVSRITCIGAGVPTPDWSAYEASTGTIPTGCANGAGSLADAAPTVVALDKEWAMAHSWRGNLAWQSVFKNFNYTLEGIYSLNVNQPGSIDRNFSNTPRFVLPGEGRTMFAQPADIVAQTGIVNPLDARLSSDYGRVMDVRGDGRSVSKQATLTISPNLVAGSFRNFYVSGAYTLGSILARERGFDATTFGSPAASYWTRGDFDARHQFLLQGGYSWPAVTLTFFGRVQSGLPFTPMVSSDVNGDGLANDRAFIFDPAHAADTAVANGLRTLLSSSSGNVRDCLARQLGAPAAPQSCEGPWTASLNTRIGIQSDGRHLSRRVDVGLNLANPLGGLDQLLHGSNNLHGWGTAATPDPVLYTVRGWDPTTQRFSYVVNPRFGNTRPSLTTLRAPFRLTLDVSIDIGRPIEEQQVDRWLKPGRAGRAGPKADEQDLKRRYDRNVPDLYQQILIQSDSLLLSRDQVEALQHARAAYRMRLDSVWTHLASYLANLPDHYDAPDAYKHAEDAIDGAWEITRRDLQTSLPTILNTVQIQLLPPIVKLLYDAKQPVHIRIFIAG